MKKTKGPTKFHHPGTAPRGHPVEECAGRGCGDAACDERPTAFRPAWRSEEFSSRAGAMTSLPVGLSSAGTIAVNVSANDVEILTPASRVVLSRESWRAIVEAVAEARSAAARGEAYEATDRTAPDGGPVLRCRRCRFEIAIDRDTGSTLAHERAVGPGAHPEAF